MHPSGEERLARIAWSQLTEPGDPHAGRTLRELGAVEALSWLRSVAGKPSTLGPATRASVARWSPRLEAISPEKSLLDFESLGGRVVIPGDEDWPAQLGDLADRAPHMLWVRGVGPLPGSERAAADSSGKALGSIALVGSRASTRYGESIAAELALGLAEAGHAVVSGGAYGIDAAAHRGALAARGGAGTLAILAGGADRAYPAGNAALLAQIAHEGVVLSEMPPGAAPTRHRFLARNRLIAALGAAVVVVEAAHRSGAISTAHHAADLLRPLGVVPGPVTSAASAGCHRLLREGMAVCVTGVSDVLEMLGPLDVHSEESPWPVGLLDGLDPVAARVFDALPVSAGIDVDSLVRGCGLSALEVMAGLGALELAGRVRHAGSRWARVAS